MESQLQSLIDKIRADGVAEAEKQAEAVLTEAEQKAQKIVSDAKSQAGGILDRAKQDAERTEQAGKKALEQAGRNLVLGLEKSIRELFDRTFKEEIKAALTPDALGNILQTILSKWEADKGVVVELNQRDQELLLAGMFQKLQEKAKGGVMLRPVETIDAGFLISEKDGDLYYDFTSTGIAEILSQYLNPMLGEILRKGMK